MTRILIADDERDERNVVRFLLKKYGFEMDVREAENGRDALGLLQEAQFDILFTDVQMPFMQGTELAERARALWPDIHILFFSGYNEFSYVKSALNVGAVNYILKPMNPEEFRQTMEDILRKIGEAAREKRELEQASLFRRGYVLTRLLGGADPAALAEECGDLVFLENYSRVLLLQFDSPIFDQSASEGVPLESIVEAVLQGLSYDLLNIDPSQSVVLFKSGAEPAASVSHRLHCELSAAVGQPCYVSLSGSVSGPHGLAEAYGQAERALEDRFFFADVYLFPIEAAPDALQESAKQDDLLIQSLSQAARDGDAHGLRRSVDILFEKYDGQKEQSHIYVRYLFSQAAEAVSRAVPDYTDEERRQLVEQMYRCRSLAQVRQLLSGLTGRAASYLEAGQDAPRHAVQLVKRYIQEHYGEDLSLDILAGKCYLSPRYLSDLFIRETGCGLNKYIKNVRMEHVKELLLTTNRKVQDICREVGYANFSYFCRSFRETYGKSPEAFRQAPHKGAEEEQP